MCTWRTSIPHLNISIPSSPLPRTADDLEATEVQHNAELQRLHGELQEAKNELSLLSSQLDDRSAKASLFPLLWLLHFGMTLVAIGGRSPPQLRIASFASRGCQPRTQKKGVGPMLTNVRARILPLQFGCPGGGEPFAGNGAEASRGTVQD